METMTLESMEAIEGGGPWIAGVLVGLGIKLLLDDGFIQGLADGIVGAPKY